MLNYIVVFFIITILYYIPYGNKIKSKKMFLILSGIVLILFSTFRGDFTSDYKNYNILYNQFKTIPITEILANYLHTEFLFMLLYRFVYLINDSYTLFIF